MVQTFLVVPFSTLILLTSLLVGCVDLWPVKIGLSVSFGLPVSTGLAVNIGLAVDISLSVSIGPSMSIGLSMKISLSMKIGLPVKIGLSVNIAATMTRRRPMKFSATPMIPGMVSVPTLPAPVAITAPIPPVAMEVAVMYPMISRRHTENIIRRYSHNNPWNKR